MARLRQAKTLEEIKKLGVGAVRQAYNDLAEDYNRIIDKDVLLCSKCSEFMKAETSFYFDKRYVTNRFPICKRCLLAMVEQREKKNDEPNETKESVQKVLQLMDKPYIDDFYEDCVKGALDNAKERNRSSPFSTYITAIQSLPNWKGLKWENSEFGEDGAPELEHVKENSRTMKAARKRFGNSYASNDLLFLENEYQDWVKRYPCENKAQEVLYENIARTQLNIDKKQKQGKDIKDDLKTLQDLMSSLQIKPSQTNSNALTEAKTFGQLIEKWEDEWDGGKPIPEPDADFKDVDKIGTLIDVFFKGHLARMMGLKNGLSHLYDKFIKKYTVNRPEYDEDSDSEAIFEQLFGKDADI